MPMRAKNIECFAENAQKNTFSKKLINGYLFIYHVNINFIIKFHGSVNESLHEHSL